MCAHLVATRCSRACVRRCLPPCFPAVFQFEPNVGGPFVRKCRPTTQFALSHSLSQSLPPMLESRFFVAQTYSGRGVVIVHRGVSGPRLFLPSFLPPSLNLMTSSRALIHKESRAAQSPPTGATHTITAARTMGTMGTTVVVVVCHRRLHRMAVEDREARRSRGSVCRSVARLLGYSGPKTDICLDGDAPSADAAAVAALLQMLLLGVATPPPRNRRRPTAGIKIFEPFLLHLTTAPAGRGLPSLPSPSLRRRPRSSRLPR